MAMAPGGVSKHFAGEIVEGGKESDGSVAVVIVSLGANMPLAQRQAGLTALEGLALALFIAAEHGGPIRRIEIQAHHVPELLFKLKVLGELETMESMGLQLMGRPETLNARFAQAGFAGHRAHAPRPALRRLGATPDSRPVLQPSPQAAVCVPVRGRLGGLPDLWPPSVSASVRWPRGLTDCSLADLFMGESLGQAQDDPGSENIPLTAGLGVHDALEVLVCWQAVTSIEMGAGIIGTHDAELRHTIQSLLWDITLVS